jgi:thioredoxin reductase (NADPH)
MSHTSSHDIVVIGAGVAGLSAAREALRAGRSAAYLEAQMFGGLILNVNEMDGAIEGSGAEFASNLMGDVADLGGDNLEGVALGIERDGEAFIVASDAGRHRARAVIVASGAALKKLGVPGEGELEHKGVSHCADCDGPMFQGQDVVVVGGGDSALQSALVLAKFCARVHLVHRRDAFRAKPEFVERVRAAPNIQVHWNSEVSDVLGTDGVEGARVNGETIPCSGFFALIGLEPASSFLPSEVPRDERGALVTGIGYETAIPGLFAAGAVRSGCGGMIEDAIAEGEAAARAAVAKLAEPAQA